MAAEITRFSSYSGLYVVFFFNELVHQTDKPLKPEVKFFPHSALMDVGFKGTVTTPPAPYGCLYLTLTFPPQAVLELRAGALV